MVTFRHLSVQRFLSNFNNSTCTLPQALPRRDGVDRLSGYPHVPNTPHAQTRSRRVKPEREGRNIASPLFLSGKYYPGCTPPEATRLNARSRRPLFRARRYPVGRLSDPALRLSHRNPYCDMAPSTPSTPHGRLGSEGSPAPTSAAPGSYTLAVSSERSRQWSEADQADN